MKQKSKLKDLIEDIVDSDLLALDESDYQSQEEARDEDEDDLEEDEDEDEDEIEESEDDEINEGSMDSLSLSDLWNKHRSYKFTADQGYGIGHGSMEGSDKAANAIYKFVSTKYGKEVADDMNDASDAYVYYSEYAGPGESKKAEDEEHKLRQKHDIKESEDEDEDEDEMKSEGESKEESEEEKTELDEGWDDGYDDEDEWDDSLGPKKCPWKFRLNADYRGKLPSSLQKYGKDFDDESWQGDLREFDEESDGWLPPKALKAKIPYMIWSGYGDLTIYGNSLQEIKTHLKEYDDWNAKNENFKVDLTNVSNLIESEAGLTEEFKSKAALIFEAEVKSQLRTIREGLKKTYTHRLEEAVSFVEDTLTEQIDGYLTYAVQQWMKENRVAIESSLRTEIAENFMGSLKTLFTESYVEVPASKLDLFAKLEEEKQEVETKLGRSLELLGGLVEKVEDLSREKAIEEACEDLTQTEALRLKKLAESVEFTSENTFADKVKTLKEFYFTNKSSKNKTKKTLTEETSEYEDSEIETIVEGQILEQTKLDPEMSQYLKALNAMNKSVTY